MTDREVFALELSLMDEISSAKFSWRKVLKMLELNAIAERN